jgi:hypothetical protein
LHGRKPFKENKELNRELLRIRGAFFKVWIIYWKQISLNLYCGIYATFIKIINTINNYGTFFIFKKCKFLIMMYES